MRKRIIIFLVLCWLIFSWALAELFKDTVFGWISSKLGQWLGITEATVLDVVALIVSYGITGLLAAGVIAFTAGVMFWFGRRSATREGIREAAPSFSALQMTVGEGGPYFGTEGGIFDIKRTFNLKLENIDTRQYVSDCSIQILNVTPATDYVGPWRIMEGLGLAAGDYVFIPLVTYGEAREPDKGTRGDNFITMGTENGRPYLDVGEKYTVALKATAPETSPCEFQCKVWVDEDGRLRIEGD